MTSQLFIEDKILTDRGRESTHASHVNLIISLLDTSALSKPPADGLFNMSSPAVNFEELNQNLLDVQRQCDDFREQNSQLILSQQQLEQQLAEREYQLSQSQIPNHQAEHLVYLQQHNESLLQENQTLQRSLADLEQKMPQTSLTSGIQRVDSPREVRHLWMRQVSGITVF